MKKWLWTLPLYLLTSGLVAQECDPCKVLERQNEQLRHRLDRLEKAVDDLLWYQKVGDVAFIDKVTLTGPPPRVVKNPTGQGATNPVRFPTYIFIPRSVQAGKRYPLLVLPHGGVHSNFNTFYAHIIRELMAQGYVVAAPEYRGSTGYGSRHYRLIDYGGLEVADVKATRDYMIRNYELVDSSRVGILGWSHGGLITLMSIFDYPDAYRVAYAGVPVSDLIARMGYKTQRYRDLYEADYHIGKSAYEDVEAYRRRSPAWQAHRYRGRPPLLIHTNTNDGDVHVLEVEHLIKALKATGHDFDYEIYEDVPGGHTFDRIDTYFAKEVRLKIYRHLARQLDPPHPLRTLRQLQKAAYGF